MLVELYERIKRWLKSLDLTVEERRQVKYIILGSTILAVLLLIMDNLPLNTVLLRNTYGGGTKQEELLVSIEELWNKEPILVNVSERLYTEEELEIAQEEAWNEVIKEIKKQHEDFNAVSNKLDLPTKVKGYPFLIEWNWSPRAALSSGGIIDETYLENQGLILELTGTLIYEEEEISYIQSVRLIPQEKSQEDIIMEELLANISLEEMESQSNKNYILPVKIGDSNILWERPFSNRGFLIFGLGIVVGILLLCKKKQDLEVEKRQLRQQMEGDYPEIIGTFVLYMGAGMTSKNAWQSIVNHYQASGKNRPSYEEMKKTAMEMKNGGGEMTAYEHFAYRVDIPCYRKFALLLAQNVKKGTKGISQILEREATEAYETRKRRAKTLGEAAGTKLLMPMFLMLAVVLVIVVIPAFFSIQL